MNQILNFVLKFIVKTINVQEVWEVCVRCDTNLSIQREFRQIRWIQYPILTASFHGFIWSILLGNVSSNMRNGLLLIIINRIGVQALLGQDDLRVIRTDNEELGWESGRWIPRFWAAVFKERNHFQKITRNYKLWEILEWNK